MTVEEKIKEANDKFDEWQNSPEGVYENLHSIPEATLEDEQHDYLIVAVLLKLPKEIRERVLEEVIFVHTTAYGTVHKLDFHKFIKEKDAERIKGDEVIATGFDVTIPQVFIILNFKCLRNDERKKDTIAHEIAHFINNPDDPTVRRPADKEEREADDLAEKWGFKRSYKSYKRFKGAVSGMG